MGAREKLEVDDGRERDGGVTRPEGGSEPREAFAATSLARLNPAGFRFEVSAGWRCN